VNPVRTGRADSAAADWLRVVMAAAGRRRRCEPVMLALALTVRFAQERKKQRLRFPKALSLIVVAL
jgi:hypothetical protein